MKFIIDTSSWVALVRYYHPFDNNSIIYDFFREKVIRKDFILLDEVAVECSFVAKKIVVNNLDFIKAKENQVKTNNLLPNRKFYNLLENQFCNQFQKRRLNESEFEAETTNFLKSADAKIILQALKWKDGGLFDDPTVVSEETESANDSKLFKKIPLICKAVEIECITLPQLLDKFSDEIQIKLKSTIK